MKTARYDNVFPYFSTSVPELPFPSDPNFRQKINKMTLILYKTTAKRQNVIYKEAKNDGFWHFGGAKSGF